jgi:hypothetical protein
MRIFVSGSLAAAEPGRRNVYMKNLNSGKYHEAAVNFVLLW